MLWIVVFGSIVVALFSIIFGIFELLDRNWKYVLHNVIRIIICVLVFFVSAFCLGAIGVQSYQET